MLAFNVHNLETAPDSSKPALKKLKESVGMIPNLAGAMANSPVLIEAFESARNTFQKSSLTPQEREVLSLTNAVQNGCSYCVAIHSTFALKTGVDQRTVDFIRTNKKPENARFGALFSFSKLLIEKRGQANDSDKAAFIAAGFNKEQALDVVVGLAVSLLANYGRHITQAPLDEMLKPQEWTKN
jgi:uncharacterized peroxidase-related enzyme